MIVYNKVALSWFLYFVSERHNIYEMRQVGEPFPWTRDKILQTYKFTNVFRELDTGTIWLRENIREPYANHQELFFNIAMYRLYNYVGTAQDLLHKVGFIDDYRRQHGDIIKVVRDRKRRGEHVFTGAHMITGTLGGDKIHQVFDVCLLTLWDNRKNLEPEKEDTLEMAFNRINGKNPGYGPFTSYEVITDLRHTRYLKDATDIMTWANPGPGAARGIYRILGLKVGKDISKKDYPTKDKQIYVMRDLLSITNDKLEGCVPTLEMRDIEHSLCEWDKYERVRWGEGRPRTKYHLRV